MCTCSFKNKLKLKKIRKSITYGNTTVNLKCFKKTKVLIIFINLELILFFSFNNVIMSGLRKIVIYGVIIQKVI